MLGCLEGYLVASFDSCFLGWLLGWSVPSDLGIRVPGRRLVDGYVGWLVGCVNAWLYSWLHRWLLGRSVRCLVGEYALPVIRRQAGCLVGCVVSWSVAVVGCLLAQLVGVFVDRLVGWFYGCLVVRSVGWFVG